MSSNSNATSKDTPKTAAKEAPSPKSVISDEDRARKLTAAILEEEKRASQAVGMDTAIDTDAMAEFNINTPLDTGPTALEGATLAQRLPRFSEETASRLQILFSRHCQAEITLEQETGRWHFHQVDLRPESMTQLTGLDTPIWLTIDEDGGCLPVGERAWQDYQDQSRLVAWMVAHEPLLRHLSGLMGAPVMAEKLHDQPLIAGQKILLGWTLELDGRITRGVLAMPEAALTHLFAREHWQPRSAAPAFNWRQLPVPLGLYLDAPPMPLEELRSFQTGDVMIIDQATHCLSQVRLTTRAGDSRWQGRYQDTQLVLTRLLSPHPPQENSMQDKDPAQANQAGADSPSDATGVVNSLAINLSFRIGEVTLTLGELEELQPGYIFNLQDSPEKLSATLLANGQPIGTGKLVMAGDALGIQLTELKSHGIR